MPLSFPMLSFEQVNPGYTAAGGGMSLADQLRKLQMQDVAAKYQQPSLQEALKSAQLENQLKNIQAQYAEPSAQQELTKEQLENVMLASQAQVAPEMQEANLKSVLAKTQWLPYQALGQYASGLGKLGQAQYYMSNPIALMRALQSPEFLSLYGTNPDVAAATNQALANVALKASGGGIPTGAGKGLGIPSPQQFLGNQATPTSGISNIGQINISPQDIQQGQLAASDVLTRKRTPTQILNQQYYGNVLDNLFTEGSKLMPSVVQYAGAVGAGKKGTDALKAAFGSDNKQYEDYRNFTQYIAPSVANEMRRVLGGQATDAEMKMVSNLANPTYWNSNPELAMKQWNYLQNLYSKSISGAISKTPTQVQTGLRQKAAEPAGRVKVKDKSGNVGTIPMSQLDEALKEGYTRM